MSYLTLQANDEKLGLTRLLKMAKSVATGMDYLSAIGFVHRVSHYSINPQCCVQWNPFSEGINPLAVYTVRWNLFSVRPVSIVPCTYM